MTTQGQRLEARLKKRRDKQQSAARARQKENYDYAKSLGFQPKDAVILQNWKREDIEALARERGYISASQEVE